MNADLSGLLRFVGALHWNELTADEVARGITESSDLVREHDQFAGENWIRILRANVALAYIHVERPLVLAAPELELPGRPRHPAIIVSSDLSKTWLSVHEDAFAQAFPNHAMSDVLRTPFSFDDLWFATV